jgi:hypothetical protein
MLKLQPDERDQNHLHYTYCCLPYTKLILNSWGEVSMCCHQLTQLGKLTEDTNILDIWNSPLAKEIRSTMDRGDLHPVCTSWNSCPFIVKERTMFPQQMYRRSAYPLYLEICLPDKHCNVGGETPDADNPACMMCRRNFHIPDQPDLTEFLCEKSKPLMPYLKYLCVLGIAEPFWKDALFRIFEKLDFDRFKHQIEFTTNTNGICLNERVTRRFFEATTMSDLAWSIDAATPHTHQKLRRLDTFDLVTENLRRWVKLREEYGGKQKHKVCIYNNINMLNVQEMTRMVELAHEWGVDKMIMLPTYDQSGVVQLGELMLCEKNVKIFKKASEEAMECATRLRFDLHYSKRFDIVPPPVADLQAQSSELCPDKAVQTLVQLDLPKKVYKLKVNE